MVDRRVVDQSFRTLITDGFSESTLWKHAALREIGRALSREQTDSLRVAHVTTAALDLAYGDDARRKKVVLELLGLTPETVHKPLAARRAAARQTYGKVEVGYFNGGLRTQMTGRVAEAVIVLHEKGQPLDPADLSALDFESIRGSAVEPPVDEPATSSMKPGSADRQTSGSRWWFGAAVAATLVVLGTLAVVEYAPLHHKPPGSTTPSLATLTARANRSLSLQNTPVPGQGSSRLGFGDSVGGRPAIPYLKNTDTSFTPVLNSFIDLEYGIGQGRHERDERRFVHATVAKVADIDAARLAGRRADELRDGEAVSVGVYISNNAAGQTDCDRLVGRAVAYGVRVRLAVWRRHDGLLHVIRVWVAGNNTYPRWITDAVAVTTPRPARLELDTSRGSEYRKQPSGFDGTRPGPVRDALRPAGMPITRDGLLGACWENRVYVRFVFLPVRTS